MISFFDESFDLFNISTVITNLVQYVRIFYILGILCRLFIQLIRTVYYSLINKKNEVWITRMGRRIKHSKIKPVVTVKNTVPF